MAITTITIAITTITIITMHHHVTSPGGRVELGAVGCHGAQEPYDARRRGLTREASRGGGGEGEGRGEGQRERERERESMRAIEQRSSQP